MSLDPQLTRRRFLQTVSAAAAGSALATPAVLGQPDKPAPSTSAKGWRVAHLTDVHFRLEPAYRAKAGLIQCLEAVHKLDPLPDAILMGGDMVHDARSADEATALKLFEGYQEVMSQVKIPVHHCLGNHDVLGWNPKGNIAPEHPRYGKKLALEMLQMKNLNHGLDLGHWRVLMLDSVEAATATQHPSRYRGGMEPATLTWLEDELKAAGDRPKLICTHIPLTAGAALANIPVNDEPTIPLPSNLLVRQVSRVYQLLVQHGVKLVLTGHLHQREVTEYRGITFVGQGAVSGRWWGGANQGTAEGFGVIDLMEDGSFTQQYVNYGWQAS